MRAGAFAVSVPTGAPLALRPRRSGGTGGAVSALDAAWVLQSVAGLRPFDAMQIRACDVTGNGTLSTLDASDILLRVVGTIDHLPVAVLCGSDFVFAPTATPPILGRALSYRATAASCRLAAIELEPVLGAASGLDFSAAAFGDCTGNWIPSPAQRRSATPPRLRVGRLRRSPTGWRLPVAVTAAQPLSAVELALAPGSRLRSLRPLGDSRDALVRVDAAGARAALASRRPSARMHLVLSGAGAAPVIAGARVDEQAATVE